MNKIEISLLAVIIISILLKVFSVAGADVLLGVSLSIMAMVYYPFGLFIINSIPIRKVFKRESYKGISFLKGFGSAATGITLSIVLVGIMFKFLLYPGASVMLSVGLISSSFILSITLYKFLADIRAKFYRQMMVRMLVFIAFGSILFFTSGTSLVGFFYKDYPEYVKAYEEAAANPDDIELQKRLDEEFQKVANEE
jgi:hypothetical protein